VSCGAIFGLTTATFACLMGQPRIFFSMAQDGLLFKIYGRVNPKTGVPVAGTIITGIMTAFVACFIDLESLANTISLGTLQVFTFVNAGVIILRMTPPLIPEVAEAEAGGFDNIASNEKVASTRNDALFGQRDSQDERSRLIAPNKRAVGYKKKRGRNTHNKASSTRSSLLPDEGGAVLVKEASREFNSTIPVLAGNNDESKTNSDRQLRLLEQNGSKPHFLTLLFTIFAVFASRGISYSWPLWLVTIMLGIMLLSVNSLFRLPQAAPPSTFSCPCVPAIPLLGIVSNSYMMGSMPLSTWWVTAGWLFIGVCFYFSYGIHHSELRKN